MNLKEIKELVEFIAKQDLNEFEFEQSGFKIRIKRGAAIPTAASAAAPIPATLTATAPIAGTSAASYPNSPAVAIETTADVHIVKSPIVGTFYRSAGPDAEPFVKTGDLVEKGSVLCIIEAMKLMNEIESDVAGEVVNIYVETGNPVEYGEPLFAIRIRS